MPEKSLATALITSRGLSPRQKVDACPRGIKENLLQSWMAPCCRSQFSSLLCLMKICRAGRARQDTVVGRRRWCWWKDGKSIRRKEQHQWESDVVPVKNFSSPSWKTCLLRTEKWKSGSKLLARVIEKMENFLREIFTLFCVPTKGAKAEQGSCTLFWKQRAKLSTCCHDVIWLHKILLLRENPECRGQHCGGMRFWRHPSSMA